MVIYKQTNTKWITYFNKIKYHVTQLKEEYDFPDFNFGSDNYNPITLYELVKKGSIENYELWSRGLRYSIDSSRPDLIIHCLNKCPNLKPYIGLVYAISTNNTKMVLYFLNHYKFSTGDINILIGTYPKYNDILISYRMNNMMI